MIFILFSVEKDLNWSHGILIKKQEIKKQRKGKGENCMYESENQALSTHPDFLIRFINQQKLL